MKGCLQVYEIQYINYNKYRMPTESPKWHEKFLDHLFEKMSNKTYIDMEFLFPLFDIECQENI